MKRKLPLNQEIYLPEYFSDIVARTFEKESEQRILYWDFRKSLDEKVKMQIEILLNEIVKSIKNKAERRNGYLLPLKSLFCYAEKSGMRDIMKMESDQEQEFFCMLKEEYGNPCLSQKNFIFFCRRVLFLKTEEINWEAKVWFTERLNISSERYSRSNTIESFSFIDIHSSENRQSLQRYLRYLLTVIFLNLETIRIHHTYVKEFLKFFEDCEKNITDIEHNSVEEYVKRLSMQHISAESYNNKLQTISLFLHYLQVTDCIGEFSNPIPLYYKKNYPVVNEIDNLDQKLEKNIGLLNEELAKKTIQYYEKMENSLGETLLMATYDKMNETNRQESIRKIECVIEGIHRASSEGKALSVSELSQNTGLSKGFFYKNEEVKFVLNKEREKID